MDSEPRIGDVLGGRYRLLRKIGEGGMGAVFEAEHIEIGRHFAIKTLKPELSREAEAIARFRREARAAGAIGHRHIVGVTDVGELPNGLPFIVLDLLVGRPLSAELATNGALEADRAVEVALQCAEALDAAHAKGIVHRDLKPDNLFLCSDQGRAVFIKVLDFGISKFSEAALALGTLQTKTGQALGTPCYMSPEQLVGSRDVDQRADVYALGVVLYEMLTGQLPFSANTFGALVVAVTTKTPPAPWELRPGVPRAIGDVALRAMAREPSDRFPDMRAFGDALRASASVATESFLRDQLDRSGSASGSTAALPTPPTVPMHIPATRGAVPTPSTFDRTAPVRGSSSKPRWIWPAALTGGLVATAVLLALISNAWPPVSSDADSRGAASMPLPAPPRLEPRIDLPHSPSSTTLPSLPPPSAETAAPGDNPTPVVARDQPPTHVGTPPVIAPDSRPAIRAPRSVRTTTTAPLPRTEPRVTPRASVPAEVPAPAAGRRVVIRNSWETAVEVLLTCDGERVRVDVPARGTRSVSVSSGDCRVSCRSAVGLPHCPTRLRGGATSMEITP